MYYFRSFCSVNSESSVFTLKITNRKGALSLLHLGRTQLGNKLLMEGQVCCGEPHIRSGEDFILIHSPFWSFFLIMHDQELDGENGTIAPTHTVMITSELDKY